MASFTSNDVRSAFLALDRDGYASNKESTKWNILDDASGKAYPPKLVLAAAKEIAGDKTYSGGGGNRGTNNALRERGFSVVLKPGLSSSEESDDVSEISRSGKSETTKKQLIDARLGQGGYRAELIEVWSGKCALTGISFVPLLRASHIKPWRESDDSERLDAYNGLLLAAHIDALFDRYLISFDADGRLLISAEVPKSVRQDVGLDKGMMIKVKAKNLSYLVSHRKKMLD